MISQCEKIRIADILEKPATIFPASKTNLRSIVTYINDNASTVRMLSDGAYSARCVHYNPIAIGKLPSGIMTIGHDFWMQYNGAIIEDSVPHSVVDPWQAFNAAAPEPTDIDAECVMLTRFGHGTWGHWLGEILPLAAVTEIAFPGRFRFAVSGESEIYDVRVIESLAAYGIGVDRLIRIPPGRPYRFINAYALTPCWSDSSMHPAALEVMRGSVRLGQWEGGCDKIAMIRNDDRKRNMSNASEVSDFLSSHGFSLVDMAHIPFCQQVRAFQFAETVFGVMGSNLSGLMYSPTQVRVVAVRPSMWLDRFFYALAQHLQARWVELAGPSCSEDSFSSPFFVPIDHINDGLKRF